MCVGIGLLTADNSMGRDFEKESAPKEHYQRHRPAASDVLRVSHTFSRQLDQKKTATMALKPAQDVRADVEVCKKTQEAERPSRRRHAR